jgi:hypothetical protein
MERARGMPRVVNIFNPGVYYNELVHGRRVATMMTTVFSME